MSNKLKGTALGRNAVIFLDVDGVLTSERCNGYYDFDLWAVNFFLWACEQSGAKIVMSSAWRNLPRAKEWFTEMFGKHLHKDWRTGGKDWHRGDEIDEWLEQHPEVDNFVIVDDTIHGLEGHKANLVFTSYCGGEGFILLHQAGKPQNRIRGVGFRTTGTQCTQVGARGSR